MDSKNKKIKVTFEFIEESKNFGEFLEEIWNQKKDEVEPDK